jgi:dephospho-CoA kinase
LTRFSYIPEVEHIILSLTLIVAITGMPGAGKSTAASALEEVGLMRIIMGDVIRQETKRRGMQTDAKSTAEVMKDLRKTLGDGAIAELSLRAVGDKHNQRIVIDGIRSVAEVDEFRKKGKVLVVAIHASRSRRFDLLKERGRADDPLTWEMFLERDKRELGVGIGEAIVLADEMISNEHITPRILKDQVVRLAENWMKSVG